MDKQHTVVWADEAGEMLTLLAVPESTLEDDPLVSGRMQYWDGRRWCDIPVDGELCQSEQNGCSVS